MYKSIIFILFSFSFLGPINLDAYQSAHVIVISNYGFDANNQPKQYVLFGLTKKGKLSTFGGLRDPGENDPKDTAAREAFEEALGILGSQDDIRMILEDLQPLCGLNSGHLSYVLPGQYYGNNISYEFKKIRFDKNNNLPSSQKEMVDIVAVRVDKIREKVLNGEALLFKDNKGKMRPLRDGAEGAIKIAVEKGQL